jgi:hypothetical protein
MTKQQLALLLALLIVSCVACGSALPTAPQPDTSACPEGAALLVGPIIQHPPKGAQAAVRPDSAILADPPALQAINQALQSVNELTGLRLYLEPDPRAPFDSAPLNVFLHINPNIANAAEEVDQPNGWASITFQDISRARREPIILHELLHWVGLKGHSPIPTEMMCGEGGCDPNRTPSARERALISWVMGQPNGPSPCTRDLQ